MNHLLWWVTTTYKYLLSVNYFKVNTSKTTRTSADEWGGRLQRTEQHHVRGDEGRHVAEAQDREAFLEVEARLTETQIIIKRQHLNMVDTGLDAVFHDELFKQDLLNKIWTWFKGSWTYIYLSLKPVIFIIPF